MGSEFKKLCRLAGETVAKYRLITAGDRIIAGLSGGKDSLVMMHVLKHLQQHAPVEFSVTAATFDPGFPGFGLESLRDYCRTQQWEHHVVKLNVAQVVEEKSFDSSPCVLCSRLRRGKLYGLANELGCNKLALGQHLDDILTSFMMSLCRGQGLTTMAPLALPENPAHPAVIRVLAMVPEELIIRCAAELEVPVTGRCIYYEKLRSGDRAYFAELLKTLTTRISDLRSNMAKSLSHVELEHLLLTPPAAEEEGEE